MEKMIINFLGTGGAIPTRKNNHSGILVSFSSENILIDCGEGIQRQFRIAGLSPTKLTKILITHWHGDHFFGLPGLLRTLAMSEYNKTLEIYGPKGTKQFISLIEKLTGKHQIKIKVKEVSRTFINTPLFSIEAKPMKHGIPTNAYSIIIKDKRRLDKAKLKKLKLPNSPLLKKLQEGKDITYKGKKIKSSSLSYMEKGKKITIILDTAFNTNAIKLAKNSDLLIAESSFSSKDSKIAKEYKHLTAKEAATIAKKAKSKKLILTHISQRYEKSQGIIEKEAKSIFPKVELAKDLMKIEL